MRMRTTINVFSLKNMNDCRFFYDFQLKTFLEFEGNRSCQVNGKVLNILAKIDI